MFEFYFRSFLRALMGDKPRSEFVPTISDFSRMFFDEQFRSFCSEKIEDEQVIRMLAQAERAGREVSLRNISPYITSKLNRFDLDKNLKRMTGQEKMAIDFTEVMESGKVMLVNLGRGRYGDAVTGLLASQIVSRFKAAAMKRVTMAPEKRRDFFLYVDEFQNIASTNFISMLSEARKFRLGLVLANQYADQLEAMRGAGRDSVLRAILGNVGTIVNFRLGIQDAELMEPVFIPDFNRYDLANLTMGNCYVSLKTGGNKPISISMQTRYRKTPSKRVHAAQLRAASMKKYAVSVEEANKNIKERDERIKLLMKEMVDFKSFTSLFE